MSENLKPCPYCGDDNPAIIEGNGMHRVTCQNAWCMLMFGPIMGSEEKAISAWNALPRRLQWTKEKPESPGWYWYNPGADYEPYIVRVVRGSIDGRLYVMCDGLSTMDCMTGLWSGEIEPPIEG